MKNNILKIWNLAFVALSVEFISETVRDRGNPSTYDHKHSLQLIHRKNCIKIGCKIKINISSKYAKFRLF
jgi:hypothetical protein